jgi:hypothetical protein
MNYLILITQIISSVKAVEALMPASAGNDKLNAVVAMVEGVMGEIGPLLPAVQGLIATVVAGFNAIGVFRKKAA